MSMGPQNNMPEKKNGNKAVIAVLIVLAVCTVMVWFGTNIFGKFGSQEFSSNAVPTAVSGDYYEGGDASFLGTGTGVGLKNNSMYVSEDLAESDDMIPAPVEPVPSQNDNGWTPADNDKIVYTAELSINTLEFDKAYNALKELISSKGGFVSSDDVSNASSNSANRYAYIVARIPSENFDSFTDDAAEIGDVVNKSSSAENISKSYSDTQSRIESLEIQERRLLELEAQASNVQEMLDIEDRLQSVRSSLMQARNSLSGMDTDVAYSTVSISLRDVSTSRDVPAEKEGLWERITYAASEALTNFVSGFENALIGIVANWPALVILIIVATVTVVLVRRHSKKQVVNTTPMDATFKAQEPVKQERESDTDSLHINVKEKAEK